MNIEDKKINSQLAIKPQVKKKFTIWDYIRNLFSAGEGKVSTIVFELMVSFGILIYLLISHIEVQTWLGNTIKFCIVGISSMIGVNSGLNYLYNNYSNYGNNTPQNKPPEKISYDINNNSRISVIEFAMGLFSAKEMKFSTIALVNLISFGMAIYLQMTGQIVPQIISDILQWTILGLAAVNIMGFNMGYSSYGYGGMGYGSYDYGYTQGYGYQAQGINTQSTTDTNNDGQDPV